MVAIVGIVSYTGFPVMTQFAQEVRLEQEARALANDLVRLKAATIAAGAGSGTVLFYHHLNEAAPPERDTTRHVRSYEILAPGDLATSVSSIALSGFSETGSYGRDLGLAAICIASCSKGWEAVPDATGVSRIQFSPDGHVASDIDLYVYYYWPGNRPPPPGYKLGGIDMASWTIRIASGTGHISVIPSAPVPLE